MRVCEYKYGSMTMRASENKSVLDACERLCIHYACET